MLILYSMTLLELSSSTTVKDTIAPQDIDPGDAICINLKGQHVFARVLKVLPNKLLTTNLAYTGTHPKVRNTFYNSIIMVMKLNSIININKQIL